MSLTMDLCVPYPNTMAAFCAKIAERAYTDHFQGVKRRPSGHDLCQEYTEGYRTFHARLASAIYAKTR